MLSLQGCTSHRSLLLSLSTKWFQTLVHKECSRHFQNTLHKKTIFSTKKSRLDKTKPRYNYNNPHSTLDGSNIIRNMPIQICWKHDDFTQFYKKNSNCLFFEAPWANSLLLKKMDTFLSQFFSINFSTRFSKMTPKEAFPFW